MKKSLKSLIICLAATGVVAAGFASMNSLNSSLAEEWGEVYYQPVYEVGNELNMPNIKVEVNGQSTFATAVLLFPSGRTATGNGVKLTEAGNYTVRYTGFIGNKVYRKDFTFTVNSGFYSIGSKSHASYGTPSEAHTAGLQVSLAQNETIEFTQIIDLDNLSVDDMLYSTYIVPGERGTQDFERLICRVTDAFDPSTYFEVSINRDTFINKQYGYCWVNGRGDNQNFFGVEGWNTKRKGHFNDGLGTYSRCSFDGYVTTQYQDRETGAICNQHMFDMDFDTYEMGIGYDTSTKEIWTFESSLLINGMYQRKLLDKQMVTDFDLPEFYSKKLWKGFSTSKVKISFSAEGHSAPTANFVLTSIFGMDLTSESFADVEGPEITIDTPYKVMPEGVVNGKYPIPNATALDEYSGVCKVNVDAWYNYGSPKAYMMEKCGPYFITPFEGEYALVYTSSDKFGNMSSKVLNIHAGGEIKPINISLQSGYAKDVYLGEFVDVAKETITGGSGAINVKVTAELDGQIFDITKDRAFRPETAGEWTVKYVATDYVGNVERLSYKINATASERPILEEPVTLPKAYLSKGKYTFPLLKAYDYSTGEKKAKTITYKVTYNGESKIYRGEEEFIPNVINQGDKYKVEVACDGYVLQTNYIKGVVPTIDNRLRMVNYFLYDGMEIDTTGSGFTFTVEDNSYATEVLYANALLANKFNIFFTLFSNKSSYTSFDVILTDSLNMKNEIALSFVKKGGLYVMSSGNESVTTTVDATSDAGFGISYNNGVFAYGGNVIAPKYTTEGKDFNGFESPFVYMTLRMNNAMNGDAFNIDTICNHTVSTTQKDAIAPVFEVVGKTGGSVDSGTIYTTNIIQAGDVIVSSCDVRLTIVTASNTPIKDENGVEMTNVDASKSYDVKLVDFGEYRFNYIISEMVGFLPTSQKTTYSFKITVEDKVSPTITITSSMPTTAKLGSVVALPTFTVSDNATPSDKIEVYRVLVNPEGRTAVIPNDVTKYKFNDLGKYELRIVAYDEAGNVTTERCYITIK